MDLVPVRMRDCRCPGSPHPEGDFAYLKPQADVKVGLAAHTAIYANVQAGGGQEELQVALGVAYTWSGIVRWDLTDADGKPVPVNKANVDALTWSDISTVADKASLLYSEEVIAPLVVRRSMSSPNGRTNASTSPTKASSSKRRKR